MRFIDTDILLNIQAINDKSELITDKNFFFKAYLDTCDLTFDLQLQQLMGFSQFNINDRLHSKTIRKLRLAFDVFSESREECIVNFENLEQLIDNLRPKMEYLGKVVVPSDASVFGNYKINFSGLPKLGPKTTGRQGYKIQLTSFNYTVNKEVGYIEVPYYASQPDKYSKLYVAGKMKLIPIAYKLNMEGTILLDAVEAYSIQNNRTKITEGEAAQQVELVASRAPLEGALSSDRSLIVDAGIAFRNITGMPLEQSSMNEREKNIYYSIFKFAIVSGFLNRDGSITTQSGRPVNQRQYDQFVQTVRNFL